MADTARTTTAMPWNVAPIAICLSGGGYRAAAFHLGTLAYLYRLNLLDNLASISTVSGGTFTGAAYTLSLIEGESFPCFYRRFRDLLAETDLVKQALSLLGRTAHHGRGERNIIVAMADVYARTFFEKTNGQPYLLRDILETQVQLPDVSFNATEFRTGIAFRFQRRHGAVIGNGNVSIPSTEAGGIRLADVVAASSCFPGGFEPLAFPDDFVWPGGAIPKAVAERLAKDDLPPRIALMDGGVYDNQGASTLHESVKNIADELSMFIISDVDTESKNIYSYPDNLGIRGWLGKLTLGHVRAAATALSVACFASCLAIGTLFGMQLRTEGFVGLDFALYLVPFLLTLITLILLQTIQSVIVKQVLPKIPQAGLAAWSDLKRVSVSQLAVMVGLRISSLYAMSSGIFMRRIRRLVYASIFRDKRYENKQLANLIYSLKDAKPPAADLPAPGDKLQQLATEATDMPTTLWFDDARQMKVLIACGQATLCYKMIKLIIEQFGEDANAYPADVRQVYACLAADWTKFCQAPEVIEPVEQES